MSRVQLALNVDDIEEAVAFYSRLFRAEPAKRRPGYANFALDDPALKLVLIENAGSGGSLNHLGVEVRTARGGRRCDPPAHRGWAVDPGRGSHHLLLRAAGQGLGHRPGWRALGGLRRPGRRPGRAGGGDRHGRLLRAGVLREL